MHAAEVLEVEDDTRDDGTSLNWVPEPERFTCDEWIYFRSWQWGSRFACPFFNIMSQVFQSPVDATYDSQGLPAYFSEISACSSVLPQGEPPSRLKIS